MSQTEKIYRELSEAENKAQRDLIMSSWKHFIESNDSSLSEHDVFINEYNLLEVVERVSKRKYYYKVFHGIEHLSEFKEVALLCFWICKLKPFVVLNPESLLCASTNELFSIYLVECLLTACKKYSTNFHYPDQITIKNIVYSLKYQDLTKEALIQYMECLALACGVDVHKLEAD